jgi:hypothetical protein
MRVPNLAPLCRLRSIYTRFRFCIRLVCVTNVGVTKKAEIFCSYEQANLMQNWSLKSDLYLPSNMVLGQKFLKGTNVIAYFTEPKITTIQVS